MNYRAVIVWQPYSPHNINAMETLTIQFDKKNAALQQLMQLFLTLGGHIIEQKAETEEYNPEFVAMIKKSHDEIKAGKGKAIKTEDLWN